MTKQNKTTLDVVRVTIEELGYEYNQQRGWINTKDAYNHGDPITIIATKVRHALEQVGHERVPSPKTIIENLEMLVFEAQKQYATKCYDTLKYSPAAKDTAEELAKLLSGGNYHELYPHIWRQWIYTIKCRLNGKSARCPIFPILYGTGGIGKSRGIRKLYSPLPPHKCNLVKEGQKVVDSEKHTQLLIEKLVIHLEEMGGMDKASIEKLKTILDMEYVSYVPLYTNTPKQGFVTATFIGSSNTAVKNVLLSTDTNRKWVQVNFYSPPPEGAEGREAFIRARVKAIEDFDYLNLWQSVNEAGPEPFTEQVYERYRKYVEATCRSSTPTTDYIEHIKQTKAGLWIGKKELYEDYQRTLREDKEHKPQRKDLFFETCEKHGLTFRRGTTIQEGKGIFGYDIPASKTSDTLNIAEMASEGVGCES